MKVEIEISESEIREMVVNKVAQQCADMIWNGDSRFYSHLSYEEQNKRAAEDRRKILEKIDWKNAGAQLSETVVQKFFMKLLDK